MLVGGVVTAAIGMFALAFIESPTAVGAGAVLLGMGFGVAQNSSLALMFERASASGYDMVSAVGISPTTPGLAGCRRFRCDRGARGLFGCVRDRGGYHAPGARPGRG